MEEANCHKNMTGIEFIEHNGQLIGLCIRAGHNWSKTNFLTSDDFPQQIGLLFYDEAHSVRPHAHHKTPRTVNFTTEVLFCVSGRIVYTFYDPANNWSEISSCELRRGDILCLFGAGHGARTLEPTKLIEVKQGPYLAAGDKYFCPQQNGQ